MDPPERTDSARAESGDVHAGRESPDDARERAIDLERRLSELFHLLLERRKAAAGVRSSLGKTTIKLSLELASEGNEAPHDQLYDQLQQAADRCVDRAASFPLGRVYCHWCGSFACEHSCPQDSRCVFGGYSPTGQPLWPEFVSVLLEKRHPRVDTIFGENPSPIALIQGGDELSSDQLAVYGKRSPIFQILGQVTLGYVPFPDGLLLPGGATDQRAPLAMTFQAIEAGNGTRTPVLNILGRLPNGAPVFQAIEESGDLRLADALQAVRRSLAEIPLLKASRRRHRGHGERRHRVLGSLSRLARNLERIFRQRQRRTQHSEERHLNRRRPASTALNDALHAARESIYRDVEKGTWVVIGPKSRVHVFNDQAIHVTSVVYPGETVRQRTTRGKWRFPRPEEAEAFREALARRSRIE